MGRLKSSYRNYCVYRLFIIFFLNIAKKKRLRRMSTTLLLGLSLCSMAARVFPTEDSVQTNGTKRPMETIVIQREVDWGNADSRIANVESEMKRVEAGMADVESEVKAGIADLESLISKLVGSGNGGNASQLVGGSKETGSKGDNGNQDKDNVAASKRDCTNAENCFSVFTVKKLGTMPVEAAKLWEKIWRRLIHSRKQEAYKSICSRQRIVESRRETHCGLDQKKGRRKWARDIGSGSPESQFLLTGPWGSGNGIMPPYPKQVV